LRAGSADCCLGGEPRDPIARSTSLHWLPPGRAGAAGRYRWQASGGSVAPHRRGLPTRTGRAVDTGPKYTMDSASVNCEARAQTRHRARAPRARKHVGHRARGGADPCESSAGRARPARGSRSGRAGARAPRAAGADLCESPAGCARPARGSRSGRAGARAPRAGVADLCESPAGCARPALGLAPAPPPPNSLPAHVAGEPKAAMPRAAAGVGAPPQG
jgi:hypothetical protein